ncbi:MAG: copper chaperone [Anaerolineales bacterium]|nr:MAG: copper chaperone [Anaerolineales bacterium]
MAKVTLDVPGLWADHHVGAVRDALMGLEGVDEAYVSAAWKQVLVTYNSKKTKKDAIKKALADAGYPVDGEGPPMLVEPTPKRRDPQWAVLGFRTVETNEAELKISGESRRH